MTITNKPTDSLTTVSTELSDAAQHQQKCEETTKSVSTDDQWYVGDEDYASSDDDTSSDGYDSDGDDGEEEEAGASDDDSDDEESDDDDDDVEDDTPSPSQPLANLVRIVDPTQLKNGTLSSSAAGGGGGGVFLSPAMAMFLRRNAGSDSALCRFLAIDENKETERAMRRNSATGGANAGITSVIQTALPTQSMRYGGMPTGTDSSQPLLSPFQVLKDLITEKGYSNQVRSPDEVQDIFVRGDVASHTAELMGAVRRNDLDRIRQLHQDGHNLQCCNQFGESIVHTTARRGLFDILQFLKNEAGVSLRVRCDTGRNPMHDACWTGSPNFDVVEFLMRECPDFFLMSDKRGYTPLEYVPKDVWTAWSEFLQNRTDLLHLQLLDQFFL